MEGLKKWETTFSRVATKILWWRSNLRWLWHGIYVKKPAHLASRSKRVLEKKNYKDFMKLAFLRSPLALKYFLFTIESTFFYVLYKYVSFYRINFCNSRKEPVFPLRYSIGGRIISQRLEFEFKKFKFRIDAAAWWWCNKQLRNKKNWKIFCFYFSFFDFLVFFWSYNYGRANFAWVIQNENFENRT